MTRALIRKELRELRPWAVLSLLVGLAELASQLTSQVDMLPLGETYSLLGDANGAMLWLIAFAIGTGLGTREQDEGTLAFLDGLPVRRTQVWAVKLSVAALLLSFAPTVLLLTVLGLHALSRGSLDAAFRLDLVVASYALQLAVTASGLVLGAALGWLRSLTWLALGVASTGLVLLEREVPRAAVLNPLSLLDAQLSGSRLVIDREVLLVQLGVLVLAFAGSWLGFLRAGKPSRMARLLRLRDRPVLSVLVTLLTVGTLGVSFGVWVQGQAARDGEGDHDDEDDEGAVRAGFEIPRFAPGAPASTVTKHYRLSYPANRSEAALQLAARADAVFERVHAILHVPPGEPIDVDASGSERNTEGTAYFSRIRLQLNQGALITLAHETAHVVAQRLAGGERDVLWRGARVLDEGLATWVEGEIGAVVDADADAGAAAADETATAARIVLAALHARRELRVDELVDLALLSSMRDENLKYPFGAAFIRALVRLHGSERIPVLVRAFAHEKLPLDLHGMPLWQAAFQTAGVDLAAVIDEMFREIAADARAYEAQLAALPRPRVRLVRDGDSVGVMPILDRGEPQSVRVRIKPAEDSSRVEHETYDAWPGVPVWREPDEIRGARVCVQVGLLVPPDQVLYEPWTCLPTADAEPWLDDEAP